MTTINTSTTVGELTGELVGAFAGFGPAYMKWVSAGVTPGGVTYARMRLLHALQAGGPQIMSALRGELGVTARSVTALVDALEADGLVRRTPHPTDRRATIVELTDAGSDSVTGVHEAFAGRAATLFTTLDEPDQRELLRILRRLSGALRDLGGGEGCAVARMPHGHPAPGDLSDDARA